LKGLKAYEKQVIDPAASRGQRRLQYNKIDNLVYKLDANRKQEMY